MVSWMKELYIEHAESLSEIAEAKMSAGHDKYESERGVDINFKNISFVLTNKSGDVFGVIKAYAAYAEIYVEDLWIDESLRNNGYGRKLLNYLEEHVQGQNYNNINLVTNQFQAPDFYKKCGYEVEFVRVNKKNEKLTKIFFIKYLWAFLE